MKRDHKIIDLVESMNDAYDLIQEGDPLKETETYRKLFKRMAYQTMECGYFIQDYIRKGFCTKILLVLIS